jgi:hypothetical protein
LSQQNRPQEILCGVPVTDTLIYWIQYGISIQYGI